MLRPKLSLLTALLVLPLALPLLLAAPPALAAPASDAEMTLYSRMAAVNACIARAAGVDFDKAVAIAGETIAQLIQGQHGGVIQQVGSTPLSLEDLRKGSINSAVLGAAEICPKEVPAEIMKRVQDAINRSGSAPATTPATRPAAAPAAKPAASPTAKP